MARPPKEPNDRKGSPTGIRFSFYEKEFLKDKARQAGLTLGEYVRRSALGHRISVAGSSKADPQLVRNLNTLGVQIRAMGNVVNQVALYCHTDRSIPDEWDALPAEVQELSQRISETLDQMVIADGSEDSR